MQINLIVAFDENQAIGKDNQLLWHLPDDLRYFKKITLDKPIIMGRKTFDSIGKPLPKRHNIVVTRQTGLQCEGVDYVPSFDAALEVAGEVSDVMVIGGASLYQMALPRAHCLYITKVHHCFDADVFFPAFEQTNWALVSCDAHHKDERHDYDFDFMVYRRR